MKPAVIPAQALPAARGRGLGYRLHMLSRAVDALLDERLRQGFGLSLREAIVLVTLRHGSAQHAQDLAGITGMDKTQVSRCLMRLTRLGLIRAQRERGDQRYRRFAFSERGAELTVQIDAELRAMNERLLQALAPAQAGALIEGLDALLAWCHDGLGAALPPPRPCGLPESPDRPDAAAPRLQQALADWGQQARNRSA